MNPDVARIIGSIAAALIPKVIDAVERGVAGEDVSHADVMKALDPELRVVVLDKIKTEERKAKGLPI